MLPHPKRLTYDCFIVVGLIIMLLIASWMPAYSQPSGKSVSASLHFQQTLIMQANNNFPSPYAGKHSFLSREKPALSYTSTFYLSIFLPDQFKIAINPLISGGDALSGGYGLASFPNGDAFRVGNPTPQISSATFYAEKTFNLAGNFAQPGAQQLKLILGKFSIAHYFDKNKYSDDARTQFMNWALMNDGAFDYSADTRGYIPGFIAELFDPAFRLRFAATMETNYVNGPNFDFNISKAHSFLLQGSHPFNIGGEPGKVRLLLFYNAGHFGNYKEATNNPIFDHNIILTQKYGRTKFGVDINLQQQINKDAGVFMRVGWNDGENEDWSYTDIDRTISAGILTKPDLFGRKYDTFGVAAAVSGLSNDHRAYLASGGYGFVIGDGKLSQYGLESVLESFYSYRVNSTLALSADYQFILNPGYNPQRGPVNIFGIRAHLSI